MSLISHIARAIVATTVASTAPASAHAGGPGFVYVMTNAQSGNSVVQYARDGAGHLTAVGEAGTGGLGSGGTLDPLGSQHSLVLTARGDRLLAVDAGSNELSALSAGAGGLALLDAVPSGGEFPNSVAVSGDLVYVLNAHGTPNVTGFRMSPSGMLVAIAGSQRDLPGGGSAAPADVRFSPDGAHLVVTETGTNHIAPSAGSPTCRTRAPGRSRPMR